MLLRCAFLAALIVADARVVDANPAGDVNLYVTVVSCSEDETIAPTVTLFGNSIPGQKVYKPISARATAIPDSPGVYTAEFRVSPGIYYADAKGERCGSAQGVPVSVFPGMVRHLSIVTTRFCCTLSDDTHAGIAVIVPEGISVDMVSATRKDAFVRTGVRDAGVTYFDALQPDKYFLELYAFHTAACVSVDVPLILTGFQKVFTFTMSDLTPLLRQATARHLYWRCTPY
jgi:hypothetical protein